AGKSTFIESAKLYADPSYVVNDDRIGIGNESHTQGVHVEEVTTSLPIYRLYDLNDSRELDTSQIKDEKAFKTLLVREDDLELRAEEVPGSKLVRFRIFDTPGLDDTNGNDIQNIARIFSALATVNTFNLIIIVDSHYVPLIPSQKSAFATYFDLFQEWKDLLTIVHTHVPNRHRYPGVNTKLDDKLSERSMFFNQTLGREIPSKRIDCNLEEAGPAHIWLTRNTIREILEIATVKIPVTRERTHVHKLQMMTAIDDIVHRRYEGKLDPAHKACDSLRKLSEAAQLALKIEDTKREITRINELLRQYDMFRQHWVKSGVLQEVLLDYFYKFEHGNTRQDIERWRSELNTLNTRLEDQNRKHTTLTVIAQHNAGDPSENMEQLMSKISKYRM
ncbi:hypothetical protein BGZ65_011763, partial [Modicella reniformis]